MGQIPFLFIRKCDETLHNSQLDHMGIDLRVCLYPEWESYFRSNILDIQVKSSDKFGGFKNLHGGHEPSCVHAGFNRLYDRKMLIVNGQQSRASIQAALVSQLCILAGREGDVHEPGVRFFINQIVSPQTIADTFPLIEINMPTAGRIYSYTPRNP